MTLKAVVVDKDYGSVTSQELDRVETEFAKADIVLERCHFTTEEEIIEGCKDAFAILGTGNPPITRKVMEALPELKFVQRFGVGVNSIDLDAAADLGKVIFNIPGFCAKELADVAIAMIMSLTRNAAFYDRKVREGLWPKCQYLMPGDVREMTLGLFGFGTSARYLYQIMAKGFGTKVIAYDPYLTDEAKAEYPDVTFVEFEELITESDIVSIHVHLNEETFHIFNKEVFIKMKNNAMIINTSRGPVIDQKALAWALETGEILYAGLDTVEVEPIEPDDPLLKMDNVMINPHCGSYGTGAKKTQISVASTLIPQAVLEKRIPFRNIADKGVVNKLTEYEVF